MGWLVNEGNFSTCISKKKEKQIYISNEDMKDLFSLFFFSQISSGSFHFGRACWEKETTDAESIEESDEQANVGFRVSRDSTPVPYKSEEIEDGASTYRSR